MDLAAAGFLIGQGIGRWGNFVNVEAFGSNTSSILGMTGPKVVGYLTQVKNSGAAWAQNIDPHMPVHPTFLYGVGVVPDRVSDHCSLADAPPQV